MLSQTHRALSIVLLLTGIACIGLYPVGVLLPGSWWWEPRQSEYEQMMVGIYLVVGVFAVLAAREPVKYLSFVWFLAVSNIVHGGIMLVQGLVDPADHANLWGDVPALLLSGIVIAALTPKRLTST